LLGVLSVTFSLRIMRDGEVADKASRIDNTVAVLRLNRNNSPLRQVVFE
jgi:hypothetical protein